MHGAEAVAAAFRGFARANPDAPLLLAQGAHYDILGRPATRHDLDAMSERPIAMMSPDLHTVWANTAALTAAGLLHSAVMPHGHEVVMGADGLASGELREFEAFGPLIAYAGEGRINLGIATGEEPAAPNEAERAADKALFQKGMEHCAAHGITSLVNMDGNRYTLDLLAEMRAEGRLSLRVKVPFHFKPHMDLSAVARAADMAALDDDWISAGFVKLFMDGVIDSGTAFLLEDYPDQIGHRASPLFAPERFAEIATEVDRQGLQIAVHAIGDGAVRAVIDGYAAARAANGPRDSRHRIEHIELIDRADVARLEPLGITASLQPPHAPGAMDFPHQPTLSRIGSARWRDAYQWRSLQEAGAAIAFSSDWPVADVSVLRGIQAALTRAPYEGARDERLSLMETLRAYTAGGAWAAHRDHITGTLRAGLAADLVLLGGDIEATPADKIAALGICLTVCGGAVVYEAEGGL